DEGRVWLRQMGVSQVLSHYRSLYAPRAGSPVIDAGDPADGPGIDIGAVGGGVPPAAGRLRLRGAHGPPARTAAHTSCVALPDAGTRGRPTRSGGGTGPNEYAGTVRHRH